MMAISLSKHYL